MKRNSFIDPKTQTLFEQEGHIIINHKEENISKKILGLYHKYSKEHQEKGFNTTHFSHNSTYKKELLELSKKIYQEYFEQYFDNYKVVFTNFMIKNPGSMDILPTHADWSFTENDSPPTISLWIPTIDINSQNGILGIIPKSHLLSENMRGPGIVSSFRKWDETLKRERGRQYSLSHLQTIAYDLRLLHYSLPNLNKDTRVALNITLVPQDSSLVHYTFHNNRIFKFENFDENFYLNYHAHEFPEHIQPSASYPYRLQIPNQKISNFYNLGDSNKNSNGVWNKIKSIFK